MLPYFNYKSITDLNDLIVKSLYKIPHDVDLIVGIPRSGMLPANLIALYLNKPYTDIDSFVDERIYDFGERGKSLNTKKIDKILLIDDSICSGNALNKVKQKIKQKKLSSNILFGSIYATPESANKVDIFFEIVETPRVFQWNLFHHNDVIPHSFMDIDGVLCPNPPVDDDGPIYKEYIANAPLLFRPSVEIDTIISCRLEKYRLITESWLQTNEIKYKKLIMLDMQNKIDRIKWGKHGAYKGNAYKNSDAILFIESSWIEAKTIFKISKKPVFCIETFSMINHRKLKIRLNLFFEKIKVIVWKILCKCGII